MILSKFANKSFFTRFIKWNSSSCFNVGYNYYREEEHSFCGKSFDFSM